MARHRHLSFRAIAVLLVLAGSVWADLEASGQGVPKDEPDFTSSPREWQNLLERELPLALGGSAEAQLVLGFIYYYVRQDYAEAIRWYRLAAEQGQPLAQAQLGEIYRLGLGLAKNPEQAVGWYRKAAEQGFSDAQFYLGIMLREQDQVEAVKWVRRAAEQGHAEAQHLLGVAYHAGAHGLSQDYDKAVKWYRRAAEQGHAGAQFGIGKMYSGGRGVPKDEVEGAKWNLRAAEQGHAEAQFYMGTFYFVGRGVPEDFVLAHMWLNLAASNPTNTEPRAAEFRAMAGRRLTPAQLGHAQQMARDWKPREERAVDARRYMPSQPGGATQQKPRIEATGSGFFISKAGHVLTNYHVVKDCPAVRVRNAGGSAATPVIARDRKNDLALLKSPSRPPGVGTFRDGRGVRQGDGVVAIGFPLRGLLASGANLTTGTVSALAGPGDDTRLLQITAPVQAGNSGGPLLDHGGNVVGVIVAKLDALEVAWATGDIPQNVNFALHASVARTFLDANGVGYETALSTRTLPAADVGELAKKFTIVVECWR